MNFKTIIIIAVFSSILLSVSCSKDDNFMSQEEIVELTNEYKTTLEDIIVSKQQIVLLEKELENTPTESAYLIEEMIEREKAKLKNLETKRANLEIKLGLN